jgi:hypothetical protein
MAADLFDHFVVLDKLAIALKRRYRPGLDNGSADRVASETANGSE